MNPITFSGVRSYARLAGFLAVLSACAAAALGQESPKFAAKLRADTTALKPGGTALLLVELQIEEHWHVYHPITLGVGLPTEFKFTAPPQVRIGPLRYPAPRIAEFTGNEFLGYESGEVFVAELRVADDAPPGPVDILVAVSALACKESCIPVNASATLGLEIRPTGGEPANEALVKKAQRRLPRSFAEAEYLAGSKLELRAPKIAVKGRGEAVATLKVAPGHHIYDPNPGVEDLIGARFFFEAVDGIEFGEPLWPKPRIARSEIGVAREQAGEVRVQIPIAVIDANFKPGPQRIHTLLYYQACKDKAQCYPPMFAEGFLEFEIVPAGEAPDVVTTPPAASAADIDPSQFWGLGLLGVFLFALLGGIILNVMPCVLPVLSLKLFSLMQQAQDEPERVLRLGLTYGAGVLCSFVPLAIVIVAGGVAWGGLMQNEIYVTAMTAITFAFALALLGVWELKLPGVVENAAGAVTTREGYGGSFLNGFMATALATPCVGPFLGPAVGILVKFPPLVGGLGIMTVGLGLALPMVLLAAVPSWRRFMPRPGTWMVTFKQIMGFVLLATALWLLHNLNGLVSDGELLGTLTFLLGVGMACWLLGKVTLSDTMLRRVGLWSGATALLVMSWAGGRFLFAAAPDALPWQKWEMGLPERLAADGKKVYVDFTAKWCLTCQTNKKLVLEAEPVRSRLLDPNVVLLKADFTKFDPVIQAELRRFERAGVPLNLVYQPADPTTPVVLPELLSSSTVLEALTPEAGGAVARR